MKQNSEKTVGRKWYFRLVALWMGLLFAVVLGEMGFRTWLFSDASIGSVQRSPHFYADYLSDDLYWNLHSRWTTHNTKNFSSTIHSTNAKLGWVGNFNPHTFRHYEEFRIRQKRPVLMFGDSFVSCEGDVVCFEDLLKQDVKASGQYGILNYGVGGYGIDQILLLMQEVLPLYPDAIVVVGLMTMDIDRAHLSVREAPKPRFVQQGDAWLLESPADVVDLQVPSLLYRRLLYSSLISEKIRAWLIDSEKVRTEKFNRARWISMEMTRLLESRSSCVVLFDPFLNKSTSQGWRMGLLEENFTSVLSTDRVLGTSHLLQQFGYDALIQENGHPTTLYNQRILSNIVQCIDRDG